LVKMVGYRDERAGFTLVELMVAVLVLTVGLLGLLGAAASTIRVVGEGDRTVAAAYHAASRIDRLSALGCDNASNGADTVETIYSIAWTVAGDAASRVRPVMLTVQYPGTKGQVRADTFEAGIPCRR
jgi:prepilin-type N-terminal cleavage/methylation domain-containing protein